MAGATGYFLFTIYNHQNLKFKPKNRSYLVPLTNSSGHGDPAITPEEIVSTFTGLILYSLRMSTKRGWSFTRIPSVMLRKIIFIVISYKGVVNSSYEDYPIVLESIP